MPLANDVHISAINFGSRQLEFIWSSVAPDCPAIHYNILASNCGSCPTTTNHTNVTCTDVPTNGSVCTFAIRSAVCGDITGNISDTVSITFYANELTGIPTDTTENQDKHNSGSTEIMGMHILAIVLIGSLAAALIVCVVVFIAVLLIILRRSKAKINAALELSNRAEGTTHDDPMYEDVTGSSPSDGIINTQDNVAYGHTQIPTLKESQH